MKTVALIPYFGGITTGPAGPTKRPGYLKRTVDSLHQLGVSVVWVGVNRAEDERIAAMQSDDIIAVRLDCAPLNIAYTLVKTAQAEGFADGNDHVYVTEADQILHLREGFFTPARRDYLVPHRLEKLGPGRAGADRGPVVKFEDTEYSMGERPVPPSGLAPTLYRPNGMTDSYGGAYWCTTEFFRQIPFHLDGTFVVESITGITASEHGNPWKTTNWEDCFTEHLSGHDYHLRLSAG